MKRTRLERKTPLRSSGRLTPKKRSAATFARVYGSTARVLWVKSLPCVVCGGGPCEGHHITNGGMGRKADAHQIVPLCRDHRALAHQHGDASWQEYYHGLDLTTEAARVEAAWQERCGLEPIGRVVARVLPTLTGEDA